MLRDKPKEKICKKYFSNNRFNWIITNVNSNKKNAWKMGLSRKAVPLEPIKDRMIFLSVLHKDNIT